MSVRVGGKMKNKQVHIQDEEYSCGASCIYTILHSLQIKVEIDEIKQYCQMNHLGITMLGLIECLKHYQIEANGYEVNLEELKKHLRYPCILHTQNEGRNHYIVLEKYKAPYFICKDPGKGVVKYTLAELNQIYSQKAIVIDLVAHTMPSTFYSFFSFVLGLIKTYPIFLLKIVICSLGVSLFTLTINYYFKYIMDALNHSQWVIMGMSLMVMMMILCKAGMQYLKDKIMIQVEKHLFDEVILKTIHHIFSLPKDYEQRYLKNDSVSKLHSLFELPTYLISWLESICVDGMSIVLFTLVLFIVQPKLFQTVFMILVIVIVISYVVLDKVSQKEKQLMSRLQRLLDHTSRLIHHRHDYQLFKYHKQETQDYLYQSYREYDVSKKRYLMKYQMIVNVLLQSMSIVLFYRGYGLIRQNQLSIGDLMLCYSLVSYLVEPMFKLVELLIQNKKMALLFERYKGLMIEDEAREEVIHGPISVIELENMSFSFGYREALFSHQSEILSHHLMIQGSNGSGKSTFLKVITGGYRQYKGSIKINKSELKKISDEELNKKIAYVESDVMIMDCQVLEFLLNGDMSLQPKLFKLIQRFKLVDAQKILNKSLDGHGQGLSKGQIQLIAFIRVTLLDYEMYVFDESFNHMSIEMKNKVFEILRSDIFMDKVVFVVDHQTNSISLFESCAIIKDGNIQIGEQSV